MLLASPGGRIVLVLVGTLLSVVLMRWLLLLLAKSRTGGSLLIFLSLPAFALVVGLLMFLALRFASRSGLLVGLTLLIGTPQRLHDLSRMLGIFIGMNLGLYFLM